MLYENIPVHLNTTQHRFEMDIDGEKAIINFKQEGNVFYLIHTEVAEPLEGKGIAAVLVTKTLQYLENHQYTMVPLCTYIQQFLRKHPEWKRLVANQ